MLMLFLKGVLIGLAVAAPVGPIAVLCIQYTLLEGFKVGLMAAMGASTADAIYSLVAGLGVTVIAKLLIACQFWIRLIGGLFLFYLGIKLLLAPCRAPSSSSKNTYKTMWQAYSMTFLLTLVNPMTILSFMAVFAGLGLDNAHRNYVDATLLILGIISGSALWGLILTASVAFFLHGRANAKILRVINWVSAAIILAFAIFALKGLVPRC